METDQVNVAELCAELYDGYHHNEQDTDVTIECDGQKFLCHRAVLAAGSMYFQSMFNNNVWTENVTGSVFIAGDVINAATLLEVLKYLYAGDATITSSNFIDLLHACHYLVVPGLEALCVRIMLQDRPQPIVDLLEVLFFAHKFSNESLINVLALCNMTERFKRFFRTNEFLHISADLFSTIVSKLWRSPPMMKEILRRAIDRWNAEALDEERKQHAVELHKLLETTLEIGSSHFHPDLHKTVAATQNPSLYVYSRYKNHRLKTYRLCNGMNLGFKNFGLEQSCIQPSKIRPLRFVSVDNVGVFGMANVVENWSTSHHLFTQFASANTCHIGHGLALACPPVELSRYNFNLCNLSNRGLYLLLRMRLPYNPPLYGIPRYDTSKHEFDADEIRRGIYFYNIELDKWCPVPAMISHPSESCMTVLHNSTVYVIGSRENRKMVQAYDHRERQWHRKPNVLNIHTNVQSCVLDGNIYVRSAEYCERYDPIAGRWEDIHGFRKYSYKVRRLISYHNKLWQFMKLSDHHFIEVYDPRTASWSFILGMDAFKTMDCYLDERVVDAVVW